MNYSGTTKTRAFSGEEIQVYKADAQKCEMILAERSIELADTLAAFEEAKKKFLEARKRSIAANEAYNYAYDNASIS